MAHTLTLSITVALAQTLREIRITKYDTRISMNCIGASRMKDIWKTAGTFKTEKELCIHIKPGNLLPETAVIVLPGKASFHDYLIFPKTSRTSRKHFIPCQVLASKVYL